MENNFRMFGNELVRWTGHEWEVVDEDYLADLREKELKRLKRYEELWEKNKDKAVEI